MCYSQAVVMASLSCDVLIQCSQTSFLSVFFLTGLGMMLYQVGYGFRITDSSDYLTSFQLMFSGAIVATTFFVSYSYTEPKNNAL